MSTNDFKVFAGGAGANVVAQANWPTDPDIALGFQTGTARAAAANKALRQSSIVASMVAQFIVDNAETDALDVGTITALQEGFTEAISAFITTAITGLAPKAGPTFTGVPKAPTATKGTNTTQLATCAFVQAAVGDYAPKASPEFTGTPTAPTVGSPSTSTDQIATTAFVQAAIDAKLASYLPKNNPTFTGTLTGPSFNKAP